MSARAARASVTAQICAEEHKALPAKCFGNMRITRSMFAKSMHEADNRLGLQHGRLPTLRKNIQAIACFPIHFIMFHFSLQW